MLLNKYIAVRQLTERICAPLKIEDYVVQPVVDVSPPKWHLGHTTWFFETFILKPYSEGYKEYNPDYNYVFNSYYETLGARVIRTNRGNLSRPAVDEVYQYREYVDKAMSVFLQSEKMRNRYKDLITLGLNHEEQHQELLYTDIKYILGHNPLFPPYIEREENITSGINANLKDFIKIREGIYSIGFKDGDFCFDNELERHSVFLKEYEIGSELVTNSEYLEFINEGGYRNFKYWHSEGWDWVKASEAKAPLYWYELDERWQNYTLYGLEDVRMDDALCHVNYYEAHAYAEWAGKRLPTEFEWEAAAGLFAWGKRWEWTESAYLPYPGYKKADGAIGEYNGKFMVNQMVLRGASEVTPAGHRHQSYRNFFHPHLRWQYTGIRLAV